MPHDAVFMQRRISRLRMIFTFLIRRFPHQGFVADWNRPSLYLYPAGFRKAHEKSALGSKAGLSLKRAFFLKERPPACQKTMFLTRSMQDEGIHPAWQGCGNDFSALCSEKSPRPTGKAGGYDEKRRACRPSLHPALRIGAFLTVRARLCVAWPRFLSPRLLPCRFRAYAMPQPAQSSKTRCTATAPFPRMRDAAAAGITPAAQKNFRFPLLFSAVCAKIIER